MPFGLQTKTNRNQNKQNQKKPHIVLQCNLISLLEESFLCLFKQSRLPQTLAGMLAGKSSCISS